MKTIRHHAAFWTLLILASGCTLAQVDVEVVSERTALENQVLGTYHSLDNEMLLAASVRGVDPEGNIRTPPPRSPEAQDAVTALQVQSFHRDDLAAFKRLGWIGEGRDGLLASFAMDRENPPEDLKEFAGRYTEDEFKSVISQVNAAREVIMRRVVELNENLSEKDLPEIRRIFGKLNIDNALPGEKIQLEDGSWAQKGAAS